MAMEPYGPTYRLEPKGLLDSRSERVMQYRGATVRKVQPYGCPRNGTMGMTYVMTTDGDFVGLVCKSALERTKR